MKRILSTLIMIFFLVSTFAGCATTSETGNKAALGAAIGGVAGAVTGFLKTGNLKGAAIGGRYWSGSRCSCRIRDREV